MSYVNQSWDTWLIGESDSTTVALSVLQTDRDSVTDLECSRIPNKKQKTKYIKGFCLIPRSPMGGKCNIINTIRCVCVYYDMLWYAMSPLKKSNYIGRSPGPPMMPLAKLGSKLVWWTSLSSPWKFQRQWILGQVWDYIWNHRSVPREHLDVLGRREVMIQWKTCIRKVTKP